MMNDYFLPWERVGRCRKPVIAAVSGYALGGGCEIAMMCDFIIATETARFGQPEIMLGVIPAAGGTQRLVLSIGKSKAMDLCLTGRNMDAAEAERCGLVPASSLPAILNEALKAAEKIASHSLPSVMMAKEAINRAFETTLAEGILLSGGFSSPCSLRKIRRKAWPPLRRSARPNLNTADLIYRKAIGQAGLQPLRWSWRNHAFGAAA